MNYDDYINAKKFSAVSVGFEPSNLPDNLFDFQKVIVSWACKRGKAAIFADTGLGKTAMQLAWADQVVKITGKPVLILAPLCVAQQTTNEAIKFGLVAEYTRQLPTITDTSIHVTNYEMLKNFDPSYYSGIVLDESSILKGLNGSVRRQITDFAKSIQYRLSCTATPSPNDYMELGTQCEFLGIMSQVEMLAMFFIHDGSDTSKWRLKGHGKAKFWEWMATWSIVITNPSDIGYDGSGYDLPPLNLVEHVVKTEVDEYSLFSEPAQGLQDRNKARRDSISARCEVAANIMRDWDVGIAWCNLNDESVMISTMSESLEITGSMPIDKKETAILDFTNGRVGRIVTKPKIAGFGLNWQHCNNMVFVGISDSFESFYQAVRRCHRFGQTKTVNVHIVISDREGSVLENIIRKQNQHDEMRKSMVAIMRDYTINEIKNATSEKTDYKPTIKIKKPTFI